MPDGQRAHRRMGETIREKYRLDAFIATGSMANVYAATHRNGSRVALKIMHRELARDPQMAERFRREGYFANAIGHPGVVRAIDDDVTEDGCAFIVLELLEGETLEERRTRLGGRVSLPETLQVGDAMLDVLASAHGNEVLHRDLKPENVFLTKKGEVKLLDFGVARFNDGRASSDMTSIGMVLGTPAFMPPEQALGKREEVDIRSDIWGVGATLFTCIAGEAVHVGGDTKTRSVMTARSPARPLRDVAGSVPRAVASVIDRALAFDKAERWADANAMREALRWARMSLNESRPSFPDSGGIPTPAPETKRGADEEPTLALRSPLELFDDTTGKRAPIDSAAAPTPKHPRAGAGLPSFPPAPAPLLSEAPPERSLRDGGKPPSKDDVYTSAPPVTERGEPSPPSDDDPTIGLDRDWPPDSSHTELPQTPRAEDPKSSVSVPPAPITQRLPGSPSAPAMSDMPRAATAPSRADAPTAERPIAPTNERPVYPQIETRIVPDAGEIFRAALARAEGVTEEGPRARFDSTLAMSPELAAHPGTAKTMLGMGAAPLGYPEAEMATSHPPPGISYPPPAYGPPPYASAPPPAYAASTPPEDHRRRQAVTGPGPLLATVAAKKPGTFKKNAILGIAAIATLGVTYALVAGSSEDPKPVAPKPSAASAGSAPPAMASAPSAALVSAMPSVTASASTPPSASPSASGAAAAATSAAPPRRRPRPRTRPSATAIAAPPTTEVTPPPTAAPTATPAPTPAPPPTADDSLPRKEDPE